MAAPCEVVAFVDVACLTVPARGRSNPSQCRMGGNGGKHTSRSEDHWEESDALGWNEHQILAGESGYADK